MPIISLRCAKRRTPAIISQLQTPMLIAPAVVPVSPPAFFGAWDSAAATTAIPVIKDRKMG